MKNLLKAMYYAFKPERLRADMLLRMGYVFHTEAIQSPLHWPLLRDFCVEYRRVTGVEPLCTIMTPTNARIKAQMREVGLTEAEYRARVQELETLAIIGHHGHYYTDPANFSAAEGEIRGDNYAPEPVRRQFNEDLDWFDRSGIDQNGIYSGGWWFSHPDLVELLVGAGYRVDLSFTHSPVLGHTWSKQVMREGGVRFGEAFRLATDKGSLVMVQNLIGCHNTPFVQDFSRHMNRLFSPDWPEVTGVLSTHDFNLTSDYDFTMAVLRFLADEPAVSFWGRKELDSMAADSSLAVLYL